MPFSYQGYDQELIGKDVEGFYYNKPWYGMFGGTIVKFLSNNRVRLAHSNNEFSTAVFREAWRNLTFDPQIGDTVYGTSTRIDPDCINDRGNHSSRLYWMGTVQEVHNDHVIVKMSVTGRLSKRTSIRPRP